MHDIREQLARIAALGANQAPRRIAVLGAGMAGLAAAHELESLGHEVHVYEASDRVGGRVRTHVFPDCQYHELGAMRIPASHGYTRHYVTKLGLGMRRFVTSHHNLNCFYDIRGIVTPIKGAAAKLLRAFELSAAERVLATDKVAPAIFGQQLGLAVAELSATAQSAMFGGRLRGLTLQRLESMSLGDFLRATLSGPDAVELVGATTGLEVWWDRAVTMLLRDELDSTGIGLEEIIGGTELLPRALAAKLLQPVRFRHEVRGIRLTPTGATLDVLDDAGAPQCPAYDTVICTIPFSVLRRMALDGFSYRKMRAIRNLEYTSSAKVLLHCTERFWEKDHYGITGGSSHSDGIQRSTYYPSDHAPATWAGADAIAEAAPIGRRGQFTAWSADEPAMPSGFAAGGGPGVLVGSYVWGRDAQRLGALDEAERIRAVRQGVARFHPEVADDAIVDMGTSIFWDEEPWAAGAFCFLRPGDQSWYYDDALAPEGGVHFAGEHCSMYQGWIQGALVSALDAVERILTP